MNRKLYNELKAKVESLEKQINGGKGSGNFGHSGRPGEVGGSVPEGSAPKSDADKSGEKPKTEKQLTKEITSLREQASKLFAEKRDLMLETDPEKYSSVPEDIKKKIDALDKKLDETYSKITKLTEERDKLGEKKGVGKIARFEKALSDYANGKDTFSILQSKSEWRKFEKWAKKERYSKKEWDDLIKSPEYDKYMQDLANM